MHADLLLIVFGNSLADPPFCYWFGSVSDVLDNSALKNFPWASPA